MKANMALINLYVSLWKAWSWEPRNPTLEWAEANRRARMLGLTEPPPPRVYDQEQDDSHDWEWPVVPEQARVPSTDIMRRFDPQREWEEYSKSIEYQQFTYEAEEGR